MTWRDQLQIGFYTTIICLFSRGFQSAVRLRRRIGETDVGCENRYVLVRGDVVVVVPRHRRSAVLVPEAAPLRRCTVVQTQRPRVHDPLVTRLTG